MPNPPDTWVAVNRANGESATVDARTYLDARREAIRRLRAAPEGVRVVIVAPGESTAAALAQLQRFVASEASPRQQEDQVGLADTTAAAERGRIDST